MKKSILFLCVVSLFAWGGSICAQEAVEVEEEVQLPPENSPEYSVVRSCAVSELTSFFSRKRIELTENLNIFTAFLDKLGKADEFITTPVEVPQDPAQRFAVLGILEDEFVARNIRIPEKPMSWEQMIEMAMQFVVAEGYLPVEFSDGEELKAYREVLKRREALPRKMRSDITNQVDACLKAWVYLGTINQQQGFKLYRFQEQEKKKRLEAEKKAQASAARGARSRQARSVRKEEEMRRRQDNLRYRYGYSYYGR